MADDDDEEEFARTHARETDPDTSHDAARLAIDAAEKDRVKITLFMTYIYPRDANWSEIAKGTGLTSTVSKRISDLLKNKTLEVSLDKYGNVVKRKSSEGRMVRCYRLKREREPQLPWR